MSHYRELVRTDGYLDYVHANIVGIVARRQSIHTVPGEIHTSGFAASHWSSPGSVDTQLSPSNTGVGVFNVKKTSPAEEAAEVHARVQA
jgi:hypothetical protein